MKPEKTTGDTWRNDINVRDIAAVKRTLDNNISSVVEAAYASPIDYSAGRIKRHRHSVETISEKRSQFSGWRMQLINILLVIVSYKQVVDRAVVQRPCDTHHNWCNSIVESGVIIIASELMGLPHFSNCHKLNIHHVWNSPSLWLVGPAGVLTNPRMTK